METFSYYFQFAFTVASTVLQHLRDSIVSVLEVNYDVVSTAIIYCSMLLEVLYKFINVASTVLLNILSAVIDFLQECSGFLQAFLTMLWKLSLLLLSFLNLLFRCLEQFCYCIWSGGSWTLDTIQSSWLNFKFTSINLYESASSLIYYTFSNIYGGLHLMGALTAKGVVGLFYGTKYIAIATWELIDDSMDMFDRTVRYITNSIYDFLTKFIPGLSKEVYLGVLVCCITYFFIVNLYSVLSNRGMTFPFFNRSQGHWNNNHNGRNRNYRFGREFSDDEFEMSENENGESDAETIVSDEEEDVDEENIDSDDDDSVTDDESENDETSSDESDATTNSNDIDIRLPPAEGRYNLRRSMTPCRTKAHNADDLVKAVEHEREKQKCVVCQDETKSVLILPCRHMCLCVTCGHKIAKSRNVDRRVCPLCRQRIRTIMDVYV